MRSFISHGHSDLEPVARIAARLGADGQNVWMDTQRLAPGDNILEKIEKGLEDAFKNPLAR